MIGGDSLAKRRIRVGRYRPDMRDWSIMDDPPRAIEAGRRQIGAGVRSARLRLQLTQQQLASRVAVTQPTISKLETGRTQGMRFKTLCRLVGILQIGEEYRFPDGPPPATRRLPGSVDERRREPAAGRRVGPAP